MGTVQVIRDLLNNVGIDITNTHPNGELVVPNLPSISLGAMDLTVKEMTGAYTTFSNNGVYTEPVFISRIEDKNGKVIFRQIGEKRKALNPEYAAIMVDMLKNNVSGGYNLGIKSEVGGKTGTTNDFTDGWFMGITPDLVVGTWVGGDENWVRFFTLDAGQGFVMARPFFINFIKRLEADPNSDFNPDKKFIGPSGFYLDCSRFKQGKPEDEQEANRKKKILNNEFEEEEFEEEW
jgi:penicillin-binding protein 1A